MAITSDSVREIFKGLENGDGTAFFERVADDVDWIVMGTHPLAGHYRSKKAFREGTFAKLGQVLQNGAQLPVEDLIVKDPRGSPLCYGQFSRKPAAPTNEEPDFFDPAEWSLALLT
jgi:hypothetical protein